MGPLKEDNFYPNNPVSKLEAYIILVRILGFEHLAPIGNYSLGYIDEDKVPVWAKDSIYVAKELDFIEGSDYLYPDRTITKGEASALIVDLIDYMREELKYSYREDILNN
jgi:S-layer family protein